MKTMKGEGPTILVLSRKAEEMGTNLTDTLA